MVQLTHLYMTTRKNHSFDYVHFGGKVVSLLFNTLSRFVIVCLPRTNRLLILWLQSPSTVILKSKEIKSPTVSTFSPPICHEVMGPDAAMVLVFWMVSFKPILKVITENRFPPSVGSEGWIRGLLSRQSGCYEGHSTTPAHTHTGLQLCCHKWMLDPQGLMCLCFWRRESQTVWGPLPKVSNVMSPAILPT